LVSPPPKGSARTAPCQQGNPNTRAKGSIAYLIP
jgi:hypothetical protein